MHWQKLAEADLEREERRVNIFIKKFSSCQLRLFLIGCSVFKMKTAKKTKLRFTGFRLADDYLQKAKERAAEQHRSFGKYVTHLIVTDLEKWESEKKKKKIDEALPPAGLG